MVFLTFPRDLHQPVSLWCSLVTDEFHGPEEIRNGELVPSGVDLVAGGNVQPGGYLLAYCMPLSLLVCNDCQDVTLHSPNTVLNFISFSFFANWIS